MTDNDDTTGLPSEITEFSYKGLLFKIHRADHLNFWTIKQGRNIVLRHFTLPEKIEDDIAQAIQRIKDGVDAGRGLNIDYSKIEETE